jgi:hypothetical protein
VKRVGWSDRTSVVLLLYRISINPLPWERWHRASDHDRDQEKLRRICFLAIISLVPTLRAGIDLIYVRRVVCILLAHLPYLLRLQYREYEELMTYDAQEEEPIADMKMSYSLENCL